MIRSWARLLAFVASGLLAASAGAATIKVTTVYDNGEADTQVCSIREALKGVEVANDLIVRNSAYLQVEAYKEPLELALALIEDDPVNNSYPRGELQALGQELVEAVGGFDVAVYDATLTADVETFVIDVENMTENAGAPMVSRALGLVDRTLSALDQEMDRLKAIAEADGCTDGTGFDVVRLEADTTYYLRSELTTETVFLTLRGDGNTRIEPCVDATTCGGIAPGPVHRLFHLAEPAVVEVNQLTFANGGGPLFARGGAIEVEGSLTLKDSSVIDSTAILGGGINVTATGSIATFDSRFTGNQALQNGGAIAFAGGSLALTDSVVGVVGDGNQAGLAGGAVYVDSLDNLNVVIERVAFVDNSSATASAVHIAGVETYASFVNVTFSRNSATTAATLEMAATDGSLALNNVTMVDNDAQAGTAGLRVTALTDVIVANSLIAGNVGAGSVENDCDFGILAIDAANFRRNYYAATTNCPGGTVSGSVPFEQINYLDPAPGFSLSGVLGTLDVDGFYIPLYFADGLTGLVNRGAGTQEEYRCAETDQRSLPRTSSIDSDCDIGAVEYQIGRRADDIVETFVDQRTCLDIVDNDVGDASYIAGSLLALSSDRGNTTLLIASKTRDAYLLRNPSANPDLVVDMAAIAECDGVTNNEAIVIVPPPGFRGEVLVTYGLQWEADADQDASTNGGDVSGRVRVLLDSRSGITSDSIGGAGPLMLFALLALGLRRRVVAWAALPALLVAGVMAHAADNVIYVNSGDDEPTVTTPGDGKCTLREALNTARNDQANLTGGDCLDGNEGPDIIEFTGTFVGANPQDPADDTPPTVTLNGSVISYGGVTLRCPEGTTCTIRRNPAATSYFRLIDSRGSLVVQRMTFEGGQTVANVSVTTATPGKEGGAIFSIGGVSATDSIFRGNIATVGGAIYLGGRSSGLTLTRSQFEGNVSTAARDALTGAGLKGGGVVATTQGDYHVVNVLASTFTGNYSRSGAAALSLNSAGGTAIANSTFSGNRSEQGAGAIDVSGVNANITLRNLTIVDNESGIDPQREVWDAAANTQRSAIEAGDNSVVLTTNIVADNTPFGGAGDANCGSGQFVSYYNLFGGSDCVFVATTGDSHVAAGVVFSGVSPLLGPLEDVGIIPWMHVPIDPLTATAIVDAGFKSTGTPSENQVAPLELTEKCANVDQRGAGRASGGRCDRGAYEYLVPTAVGDSSSNSGRADRLVLVDILANDIYDNLDNVTDNDFKEDCDTLDTAQTGHVKWVQATSGPSSTWPVCVDVILGAATGTVDFLKKNDLDDLHLILGIEEDVVITVAMLPGGYLSGTFPDDYVPGWDPSAPHTSSEVATLAESYVVTESMLAPGYLLRYDNNGVLTPESLGGPVKLEYVVYPVDQSAPSNQATITLNVDNVPPQARADVIYLAPGEAVTFLPTANDEDLDQDPDDLTIVSVSCPEVVDPIDESIVLYWQCQFGKVWLNSTTNELTWKPDNAFNPFREIFTYDVTDNDPVTPKRMTGSITIEIIRPEANSGSILGEDDLSDILGIDFLGAPGHVFMLSLLLSLVRRRQPRR